MILDNQTIMMVVVVIILGMLVSNMIKEVCGCKVVEGQAAADPGCVISLDASGCFTPNDGKPCVSLIDDWGDVGDVGDIMSNHCVKDTSHEGRGREGVEDLCRECNTPSQPDNERLKCTTSASAGGGCCKWGDRPAPPSLADIWVPFNKSKPTSWTQTNTAGEYHCNVMQVEPQLSLTNTGGFDNAEAAGDNWCSQHCTDLPTELDLFSYLRVGQLRSPESSCFKCCQAE